MDLNTLEKNVTLLPTPYCDFSVSDEEGNAVIFDIMESPEKTPRVYIDNDSRKEKIVPSFKSETVVLGMCFEVRAFFQGSIQIQNFSIPTWVQLKVRVATGLQTAR